jgi:hypothetical protein
LRLQGLAHHPFGMVITPRAIAPRGASPPPVVPNRTASPSRTPSSRSTSPTPPIRSAAIPSSSSSRTPSVERWTRVPSSQPRPPPRPPVIPKPAPRGAPSHAVNPHSPTAPMPRSRSIDATRPSRKSSVAAPPTSAPRPPRVPVKIAPLPLASLTQPRIVTRTKKPPGSLPDSPPFELDNLRSCCEGLGSASSSSRAESTVPGTDRSAVEDTAASGFSAAAELRDSVARITKNNVLLQTEMERTRAESATMAATCAVAERRSLVAQSVIDSLTDELLNLRIAKEVAEEELQVLQDRMLEVHGEQWEVAVQTDCSGAACSSCEQEQRQRVSGEKERSDAQAEVRKLRQLIADGQRQLAECDSRSLDWQQQAETEREGRLKAEKERESLKATAIQLTIKWEEAKRQGQRDAKHIMELRSRVGLLESQHARMGTELQHTRTHLHQLTVALEVREERDTGYRSPLSHHGSATARAHLQAEEILYRTYIEAEQAGSWQLMWAESGPFFHVPWERVAHQRMRPSRSPSMSPPPPPLCTPSPDRKPDDGERMD